MKKVNLHAALAATALIFTEIVVGADSASADGPEVIGVVKLIRTAPSQEVHIMLPSTPSGCGASGWFNLNPSATGVGTDRMLSVAIASQLSGRPVKAQYVASGGTHCAITFLLLL